MNSLMKKYKAGIEYLDYNYSYFLTHVLKIGKPQATPTIPTAAVSLREQDEAQFDFLFNEDFANRLNEVNMAFILAHETMHIVLNHLNLQGNFVDRKLRRKIVAKREKGERLTRDEIRDMLMLNRSATLFNIAADCVINDYLMETGMIFDVEDMQLQSGHEWIGESAAFLTVTEVFERIQKQTDEQDGQDVQGDDGDGDGEAAPQFVKADGSRGQYKELDNHDWMLDPKNIEKMADMIDKLQDEVDRLLPQDLFDKKIEEQGKQTAGQQQLAQSMQAGNQDAAMEAFVQQHGVQLAWVKLLNDLDPDMFKQPGIAPPMIPSFHKRRRKLMDNAFHKVYLPVYRKEERRDDKTKEIPSIVLALDVSGSIGPNDANRFVSLAMTIPQNRIKVFACVFQTTYQRIDLENPKFRQGGGTDFNAIAAFIENEVKPELKGKHPSAVVVITDGQADMTPSLWPDENDSQGWLWLISPQDRSRSSRVIQNVGTKKMLTEYIP